MLNRKTMPGGKKVPNAAIFTEGSKTSVNFNIATNTSITAGGGFKLQNPSPLGTDG